MTGYPRVNLQDSTNFPPSTIEKNSFISKITDILSENLSADELLKSGLRKIYYFKSVLSD